MFENFIKENRVFRNVQLFDGSGKKPLDNAVLWIAGNEILYAGPAYKEPELIDVLVHTGRCIEENLHGAPVCPGYIDIHHHGGAGGAYDDGYEAAEVSLKTHLHHGTTRAVMSLVTASIETLVTRMLALKPLVESNPQVLGLHAEGPFLHPSRKGAHEETLLRDPDPEAIAYLIEHCGDILKQITIAPERKGGIEAVTALSRAGIKVAVGHTSATYEQAQEAFQAGASILTHTFNAMNSIGHRAPGPVIAALRDPNVWLEIINDGIHVHPMVVKTLFLEAPERTILITDAMSATCNPDGHYMLGNLEVTVDDGVATLTHGGSLAGSTLTMDRAVAHAVHNVGVPLESAIASATHIPAKALGLGDKYGLLAKGYPADFLILDPDTTLPHRIFFNGAEVL